MKIIITIISCVFLIGCAGKKIVIDEDGGVEIINPDTEITEEVIEN